MYSQLKSFSFMGMSNSDMLLSEKDLNSMEFNFLVRPALEFEDDDHDQCDLSPLEDGGDDEDGHKEEEEEEEVQEDKCKLLVSTLRIKLPSLEEFKIQDSRNEDVIEEEDGFKTPTSLDHRIPFILPCPPAPRKPKSLPSNKRKLPRRKALLDLSNEIESLFPPSLRADLGAKIKKVRHENDSK